MSKPKKHNRKGPKSTRGGCLFCKPWKFEGTKLVDRQKHSVNKKLFGKYMKNGISLTKALLLEHQAEEK